MPHPNCFTSSSIGPAPNLHKNFLDRPETVSIYWDDAPLVEGDEPFLKVIHHCEPPDVFPQVADRIIADHLKFDLVMTYDPKVLAACNNAVFLTESACSWMDRKAGGDPEPFMHSFPDGKALLSPRVASYVGCDVSQKEFAVSFLTSSKNYFPGHLLRQKIYDTLPEQGVGNLKVWKHKSPPRVDDKRTTLEPYMFSICPENSRHAGYYTEKIVDCFVAKTVPLYWGCPTISDHFNAGGILEFSSCNDLMSLLTRLTPGLYKKMLPAVEQNFITALNGVHQWDQIEHYITEAIINKHAKGNHRAPLQLQVVPEIRSRIYRPVRRP